MELETLESEHSFPTGRQDGLRSGTHSFTGSLPAPQWGVPRRGPWGCGRAAGRRARREALQPLHTHCSLGQVPSWVREPCAGQKQTLGNAAVPGTAVLWRHESRLSVAFPSKLSVYTGLRWFY